MNYNVYVDGIHLPRVDTMITTDEHLWFRQTPAAGAQVTIQVYNGWHQGFIGDGTCSKFLLSKNIIDAIVPNGANLKYKQILHDAMLNLENETVRTEVERLGTVIAMTRSYNDTDQRRI